MLIKKLLVIATVPVIIFLGANYILLPGLESLHEMSRYDIKKGEKLYDAKKYKEALPYLEKSASQKNDAGAQFYLGAIYQLGLGTEKNYKKAKYWYRRSFGQGNVNSALNLGNMLRQGNGFKKPNPELAVKLYKWAADRGAEMAKLNYAIAYFKGEGVKRDYKKAFEIFMPLAQKGNPKAQRNVAYIYYKGLGDIKPDPQEAFRWYSLAADNGETSAYHDLGLFYLKGLGGIEKDINKAKECFIKSAESGNSDSKIMLASLYGGKEHVLGLDLKKAMQYLMSINEDSKHYKVAQWLLGLMYDQGKGINVDKKKALALFKKSADMGMASAQNSYAYLLAEENINLPEAAIYIRKALTQQPLNDSYIDTYGYILYKEGKYKEALKKFLLATKYSKKPSLEIKKHIGDTYHKLGEDNKALKAWAEALAIPESDEKLKSGLIADYILATINPSRNILILPGKEQKN